MLLVDRPFYWQFMHYVIYMKWGQRFPLDIVFFGDKLTDISQEMECS